MESQIESIIGQYEELMDISMDFAHTKQLEKELETLNRMSIRARIFADKMDREDRRRKIKDILNGNF